MQVDLAQLKERIAGELAIGIVWDASTVAASKRHGSPK
jgi:hypothetical protein